MESGEVIIGALLSLPESQAVSIAQIVAIKRKVAREIVIGFILTLRLYRFARQGRFQSILTVDYVLPFARSSRISGRSDIRIRYTCYCR